MSDVYFVRGDACVRYDEASDAVVGAPMALDSLWSDLPQHFAGGVDAVLDYGNGKAYVFKGAEYVRVDIASGACEGEARDIAAYWKGVGDQGFGNDLDAAVNYGNGTAYFFKGSRFCAYDIAADITSHAGDIGKFKLTADGTFDSDLDSVVNYGNGKLYFFKEASYVRFDIHSAVGDSEVRQITAFWNGMEQVGFTSDLDGSWAPGVSGSVAVPAGGGDSGGETTSQLSAIRQEILAQLAHFENAVEGDPVFEKEFRAHAVLEEQRKAHGLKGTTYTTCIEFQMTIFERAVTKLGIKPKATIKGLHSQEKARAVGAWHVGSPGTPERPRPGDVYFLYRQDNPAMFSHTGYVKSITPKDDGTEAWVTVDGGQGTAGKYDKDGNLLVVGKEMLKAVDRTYTPATNLITGEANQGGQPRLLHGWVDIDALVG